MREVLAVESLRPEAEVARRAPVPAVARGALVDDAVVLAAEAAYLVDHHVEARVQLPHDWHPRPVTAGGALHGRHPVGPGHAVSAADLHQLLAVDSVSLVRVVTDQPTVRRHRELGLPQPAVVRSGGAVRQVAPGPAEVVAPPDPDPHRTVVRADRTGPQQSAGRHRADLPRKLEQGRAAEPLVVGGLRIGDRTDLGEARTVVGALVDHTDAVRGAPERDHTREDSAV